MRHIHNLRHCGKTKAMWRVKSTALLRLALSWTDGYVEPDIPAPMPTDDNLAPKTYGYTFHEDRVYPCTSYLNKKTIHTPDRNVNKRKSIALYSDYDVALRSLRASMELEFAKRLLAVDMEIVKRNATSTGECEADEQDEQDEE